MRSFDAPLQSTLTARRFILHLAEIRETDGHTVDVIAGDGWREAIRNRERVEVRNQFDKACSPSDSRAHFPRQSREPDRRRFFVVPTVNVFVLVLLVHDRRRIVHVAVTDHPTAAWIAVGTWRP